MRRHAQRHARADARTDRGTRKPWRDLDLKLPLPSGLGRSHLLAIDADCCGCGGSLLFGVGRLLGGGCFLEPWRLLRTWFARACMCVPAYVRAHAAFVCLHVCVCMSVRVCLYVRARVHICTCARERGARTTGGIAGSGCVGGQACVCMSAVLAQLRPCVSVCLRGWVRAGGQAFVGVYNTHAC